MSNETPESDWLLDSARANPSMDWLFPKQQLLKPKGRDMGCDQPFFLVDYSDENAWSESIAFLSKNIRSFSLATSS
jgi:hypothetical protein